MNEKSIAAYTFPVTLPQTKQKQNMNITFNVFVASYSSDSENVF